MLTELKREIASSRLKRGLGNTHDVVAGDDLFCAVIGHSHNRSAAILRHLVLSTPGHRGQGVRADVDRVEVRLAGGFGEHARLKPFAIRERDRVNEEVQAIVILRVRVEELVE